MLSDTKRLSRRLRIRRRMVGKAQPRQSGPPLGRVQEQEQEVSWYLGVSGELQLAVKDERSTGAGYLAHSHDPEKEARLWKDSVSMVGIVE